MYRQAMPLRFLVTAVGLWTLPAGKVETIYQSTDISPPSSVPVSNGVVRPKGRRDSLDRSSTSCFIILDVHVQCSFSPMEGTACQTGLSH
jgi:hypothetical protein